MFGFAMMLLVIVGAVWLSAAVVGGLFKLTFGLLGLLFGGLFGLFALGLVALVAMPILLFALLPLALPVLVVGGLVWLLVRAARGPRTLPPAASNGAHAG